VSNAPYRRYLLATGSWFLCWGLHAVILPWLVVQELRESPERVGLVQGLALLPSLPLLLIGGAAADRAEPRRLLLALHATIAALLVALAALVAAGGLSYWRLIGFAVAAGALNALQHPARDAELNRVARAAIGRGVVGASVVGQVGQAVGGLAGAALAVLGAPLVLLVQAGVALAGVIPLLALRGGTPARSAPAGGHPSLLAGWNGAIRALARSPVLAPVFALTACVGLLFVGVYGVCLPLLVRDVYGRGPRETALILSMLPLGGIVGGLFVFARGGIRRNGRAMVLGQAFAALCVGTIALAPPLWGANLAVLGWGIGSTYFLSAGRTLFHLHAPEAQRATLLGLYVLGILGAGPIGSLLSGILVAELGVHGALAVQAGAMLAFVGAAAALSGILGAEGYPPPVAPVPVAPPTEDA
jgi:MFS family permease